LSETFFEPVANRDKTGKIVVSMFVFLRKIEQKIIDRIQLLTAFLAFSSIVDL